MSFIPISIEDFIQQEITKNKNIDEKALKQKIENALNSFWNGEKCNCGSDIWIIGSVFASENTCYTCFTGIKEPKSEYEIAEAAVKDFYHFETEEEEEEEFDLAKYLAGGRYFNDDGTEINMSNLKKPPLCFSCIHNNNPMKNVLCNLTRLDYTENEEFICGDYKKEK